MIRYTLLRALQMIPTVLLVTVAVFVLIIIIPGDPVLSMLGYYADDVTAVPHEIYDRMFKELRLDRPVPIQYLYWLGDALQGDFGKSVVFRVPVIDVVLSRVPATLYLGTSAMIIAIVISVPFGVWAAVKNDTWVDHLASGFVLFGVSVPGFWFGMIVILVFAIYLGWLPSIGYVAPQEDFLRFVKHLILPATVLGLDVAASILRFQRTDFLDQLHPRLCPDGASQRVAGPTGDLEARAQEFADSNGDGSRPEYRPAVGGLHDYRDAFQLPRPLPPADRGNIRPRLSGDSGGCPLDGGAGGHSQFLRGPDLCVLEPADTVHDGVARSLRRLYFFQ